MRPPRALVKLLVFSFSLAFVPISTYFASLKYYWDGSQSFDVFTVHLSDIYLLAGNATWSALSAVVAANVVLVAFIVQSIQDDSPLASTPNTGSAEASNLSSGSEEPKKTR
jgi:hypothetical protein